MRTICLIHSSKYALEQALLESPTPAPDQEGLLAQLRAGEMHDGDIKFTADQVRFVLDTLLPWAAENFHANEDVGRRQMGRKLLAFLGEELSQDAPLS